MTEESNSLEEALRTLCYRRKKTENISHPKYSGRGGGEIYVFYLSMEMIMDVSQLRNVTKWKGTDEETTTTTIDGPDERVAEPPPPSRFIRTHHPLLKEKVDPLLTRYPFPPRNDPEAGDRYI